ncbi:hypothetical protein QUC31_010305 [Theobroma cacao]|uniref:Uncharacterized protein LOC18599352 n=1 Tax=Theobroma cacao TaxID=3641 RepID=A0AB32V5J0_THECC|nr:PREDICTED: uncharacterized protein LOC18599352 [Theobroma cacao]
MNYQGNREEEVEAAKKRCRVLIEKIDSLGITITQPCKHTLSKLAHSELSFLSRFPNPTSSQPLSVNIGHLEAIVHILQQPFITAVSRVCKPLPLPFSNTNKNDSSSSSSNPIHVHIVCTLNKNPVWIIVSDRNPNYISWYPRKKTKGFKSRIQQVLDAAQSTNTLRPFSIVLFFSNGLTNFIHQKLQDEFGASKLALEFSDFDFCEEFEGEWINVILRSYKEACILEIKVDRVVDDVASSEHRTKDPLVNVLPPECQGGNAYLNLGLGNSFSALVSQMKKVGSTKVEDFPGEDDFVNFDTTALIALVSGISNGCAEELLNKPEVELRHRFKGNYEFVIAQAMSEIQNPIHGGLSAAIAGKRGIICESVLSEFKELVLMCGGANEKSRADQLLKCLLIVRDSPSERLMGLPTTRKLALKNKIVFGTGDYWHAPTLTANMAFVRAVAQTAMSLFTIEHRPRALTGN